MIVFGQVSCDTMTRPISSGDFDPLGPPGGRGQASLSGAMGFTAGQFVRAIMDNTAFFKIRPKGDGDADQLLKRGTSMKVIGQSDSYTKVELDSGEVGFVPTVMLEDPNAAPNGPVTGPGEFQVYPPVDASGQPFPAVPASDQPPEGAIPTVIDPEGPVSTGATRIEPRTGPLPLPPNGE